MTSPNLIDAMALSQIIGVDKGTIYDWVRRGKIPHVRLERLVRFDLEDIGEWVKNRKQNLSKSPLSRHEL
jgi:excisionase family DNA binding protein